MMAEDTRRYLLSRACAGKRVRTYAHTVKRKTCSFPQWFAISHLSEALWLLENWCCGVLRSQTPPVPQSTQTPGSSTLIQEMVPERRVKIWNLRRIKCLSTQTSQIDKMHLRNSFFFSKNTTIRSV